MANTPGSLIAARLHLYTQFATCGLRHTSLGVLCLMNQKITVILMPGRYLVYTQGLQSGKYAETYGIVFSVITQIFAVK